MAGFSSSWLDLREAADASSRGHDLVQQLAIHLEAVDELRIADLGAGTGANLRWLAPLLAGTPQHWHLLEADRALIEDMSPRLAAWASSRGMSAQPRSSGLALGDGLRVTWHPVDLAEDPLPLHRVSEDPVHLVSASALVDLVSAAWLTRLAQRCARHGSAVLLAISYDGRVCLEPPHPFNARVRDALNRHQRRDKGFGPALGPDSPAFAAKVFRDHGYRVVQARSDWRLAPHHRKLAQVLLDGWRDAAAEVLDADALASLDHWHAWHARALHEGTGNQRVGHVDLLALPSAQRYW